MEALARDLRQALRQLARSPGYVLVTVATLALGIGANVTIFSWARGVLLEPVPGARDQGRLFRLMTTDPEEEYVSLSYPVYRDFRDGSRTLEALAVTRNVAATLGAEGRNDRLWAQVVSGNFFELLQVRPAHGRLLSPEDDRRPGGHPVVVLSHSAWRRRFGSDPGIVGRTVLLNTRPYTVIGLTPPGFCGLSTALCFDAWVPIMMQEQFEPGGNRLEVRGNRWLDCYARPRPGVGVAQAQAELNAIAARLEREHPDHAVPGRRVALFPLWRAPRSGAAILGPLILVLGAVVGTFLLMACVNLAGVLLARGFTRRREMAVRLSLGARRPDLVRALLAETLLVAGLGGAAGLLVARGGLGLLEAWMPPTSFPLHLGARLDGPVLGFALLLTLLTALAAGLLPAFRATRRDVTAALRDESGSVAAGRDSTRLRQRLVVGQLALSVVLLVAAGLLARSLGQIRTYDVGFDPRGVLIASLELFTSGYDAERGRAFYRTLLERLAALPGVDAVSTARRAPLGFGGSSSSSVEVEGWEPPKDGFAWGYYNNVGPGYFSTLRMPLARGRGFTLADDEKAARVAVVNEAMARRYWGGREAVGGRFRLGPDWISVVGVVRNATLRDVGERPAPWFFLPVLQSYRPDMTVFLRTRGDPAALTRPLAQAVASLDPNLALFGTYTLEAHLGASDFRQRAGSRILGLFGVLGLALASLGLYGILAFFVAHRQREIGIRLALGSSRAEVFRLVLRQGLRLTAAGVGTGLLLGGAVARLLRALLVGVGPADPVTFAGVLLLLCVVAALACLVPARRAASVDPAATLRFE